MTDSPRRDGSEPTQSLGSGYPVDYPDPAYSNQPPYQSVYPAVPAPAPQPNPTQQLPPYPPYGYDPNATGGHYGAGSPPPPGEPTPPEPDNHEPRLWLWILAAVAILVVLGLVIALVIANGSSQETVVAPQPVSPQPGFTTSPTAPTTRSRIPRPVPLPPPSTVPPTETSPGPTETVTYEVTGQGRAINITYLDTGNMLQTEFNVPLPWSKQVELAAPANETASVSVVNFGPDVACTVTVNGVQTQHRTGTGITICVGSP
ncbi:hypothetical protein BA059_08870 [Mycolicibacterium sp. (ex Dasyatis americana)]|uniref:MmpS family transport accessory protein n=1 Tax=Mycobacterium sp. DBP42 TaxID=2545267 RepID=UPI000872E8E6|nr:MmpS family transport accessory protein [Mycobacterium sp. DBP42]OFB40694.1 hypothetical protein BA059_08870 [Mycolicibacterium sp. (ex Dasyatis americana)]TMS45759.1 hypothetical protein E0T84_30770 [Mycobacterium sp. DBP42]